MGEIYTYNIHTPGIFVQRIVKGERYEKRIERRTTRKAASAGSAAGEEKA